MFSEFRFIYIHVILHHLYYGSFWKQNLTSAGVNPKEGLIHRIFWTEMCQKKNNIDEL